MLGYSIQDYLLNSMSSMFGPLLIGLLAALVGLAVHGLVMLWARRLGADEDGPRSARGRTTHRSPGGRHRGWRVSPR